MISEQLHKDAIRFKEWHEGRAAQAKNCATFNVTPALQEIAAGHEKVAATIAALLDALPQPAPVPQLAVPVVSDDQIRKTVESIQDPDTVPAFHNGYYTLTPDELRRAILALRPAVEPMTPEQMRKAAMDEMSKIPALANHHSWKGWPGTWAFATAAVNGITAKAEGGA